MSKIYAVPSLGFGTIDLKGKTSIINQPKLYGRLKPLADAMITEFQADECEVTGYRIPAFYKLIREFLVTFQDAEDCDLYIGYQGGKETLEYIDAVLDIFDNGSKESIRYLIESDYISFPLYYKIRREILPYFKGKAKTRARKRDLTLAFGLRNLVGSAHERMSEVSQGAVHYSQNIKPIHKINRIWSYDDNEHLGY